MAAPSQSHALDLALFESESGPCASFCAADRLPALHLLAECQRLRAREIALMAREVDLITALTRIAESEPRPIASTQNRGLYRADVVEGLQRTARAALAANREESELG